MANKVKSKNSIVAVVKEAKPKNDVSANEVKSEGLNGYFDYLPVEMFEQIALKLPVDDLLTLSRTNKTLNYMVNEFRLEEYGKATFKEIYPPHFAATEAQKRMNRYVPKNQKKFLRSLGLGITTLIMLSGMIEYLISRNEPKTGRHVFISMSATAVVLCWAFIMYGLYAGEKLANLRREYDSNMNTLRNLRYFKSEEQEVRIDVPLLEVESQGEDEREDEIEAPEGEERQPLLGRP